tara:strand:+ start:544 stop:1011 length:468 start_codon:yes stop_codon:yes gene_type:complete
MNKVAFLIGSESDKKTVEYSMDYFNFFDIDAEIIVMSAHRNPSNVHEFSKNAKDNGYSVIICGAGMAAHLAGAVKANTILPVIGVPLPGGMMDGLDSLLSTVQMPKGVPVATTSVGKAGAINAAILSAEILALNNDEISKKLIAFKLNGATLSGL